MRWTMEQVAGSLGLVPPAGVSPLARLAGVSIDSRNLRPGELFIAIHGPRHDGHTFVAAALAAGAPAVVVAKSRLGDYHEEIRARLFAVDDTLAALHRLAQAVRRNWGRRLAGVTGSVGKTTAKEILAALVGARRRVLRSEGNLNNEYGLPLTLLRLEEEHEAAVVEMGMSHRGELARLCETAEPEVGVVTNVEPVHLEFFSSTEEIALAKRELVEGLAGPQPVAVLNADDARVARFAENFRGRALTFGLDARAMFRAEKVEPRGVQGAAFDCVTPTWRSRLELRLAGMHNVRNALAALAAASVWEVGAEEARAVLPQVAAAGMRGRIERYAGDFSVINDAYNSNPAALAAMTELLSSIAGHRRRILAAGEMLELGPLSPELHREAGRRAAARGVDWIFGISGHAQDLVAGAVEAGFSPRHAGFFEDSAEAGTFLADFVAPGDLLLVKGSRGVKMEKIIAALTGRFGAPQTSDRGAGG